MRLLLFAIVALLVTLLVIWRPPSPCELIVVVNTCKGYMDKTLPKLMASLKDANVPRDQIHVVVGESPRDIDDGHFHYRSWYNIDNNGLLWLTQERPDVAGKADWVVYLHDTSYVHKDFWKKCKRIVQRYTNDASVKMIRLHPVYSMTMGFYRLPWLYSDEVRDFKKTIVNYDAGQKLRVKNMGEDILFNKFKESSQVSLNNDHSLIKENQKPYGSDTPRVIEFYKEPGIYKAKANWGQAPFHTNL